MSAYRKLTETLRDAVAREAERHSMHVLASVPQCGFASWSRTLALLEEELAAMGDDGVPAE